MPRSACEAEVTYLCGVFIDKQNIGRLNVTMNQTLLMRGTQSFRDLNAGLDHSFFAQACSLLDQIVEASMIHELHHHIILSVIRSRREDLDHIGIAHGGSKARLLLQLRSVVCITAKSPAQQFQRHKAIQERIARLINRAHPASAERLDHNEMI